MAGINGGTINAYLELDTGKYNAAMAAATSQLGILQDHNAGVVAKLGGLRKAMQTVGSQLTLGLTLPILGAGIAAGKAAMDFESAFAGVRKTVDATETEYAELVSGIKQMSEQLPESANNLAAIMEIAGQLGVDKDNLLTFTETIANLGVATNLTGEEAATMLAQYANITGMDLKDIERLGSVIVDLGNNCATTEKDITEMAHRLAGTGNLLGLTDAQIMGMAATMSSLGITAEAGGSAMSRTLQKMNTTVLAGGEMLDTYAETAGTSAAQFAAAWQRDPVKALDMFLQGLGKVKNAGGDTSNLLEDLGLNDIRVTDTLLRLAGAQGQLAANVQLANDAWANNNALQNEADKRYGTTESKIKLAQNAIQNAAADIGEALLPVAAQMMEAVAGVAKWFGALDEDIQGTILTVAGLVAAAGPLLTILGTAVSILSNPVGLIAALGLAGGAAVTYFTQADRAATRAQLAERFGEISLSAAELIRVLDALIAQPLGNLDELNAIAQDVEKATAAAKASAAELSKMMIRAQMGVKLDSKEVQQTAAQAVTDAQEVINTQQLHTQMLVTAVFGENGEAGGNLAKDFNAYFKELNAEAAAVGKALMDHMGKAMRDGILTEDEQEAAKKLAEQLNHIKKRAMLQEASGDIQLMAMNAAGGGLSAESLQALMTGVDERMQNGVAALQEARDKLRSATMSMRKDQGWDVAAIAAEDKAILEQSAKEEAAWLANQYANVWDAVGQQIVAGFENNMSQVPDALSKVLQKAVNQTDQWANGKNIEQGSKLYVMQLEKALRSAFHGTDWRNAVPQEARQSAQLMYESLAPTQETLQQLKASMESMGLELPASLQRALDQIYTMQIMASTPEELGKAFSKHFAKGAKDAEAVTEAGQEAGEKAVEGAKAGSAGMEDVGRQSAAGYVGGVRSGEGAAEAAGRALGAATERGTRSRMQINSPSRVMRGLGAYGCQGFAMGLLDGQRQAFRAGYTLGDGAIQGVAAGQDSHSPSRKAKLMGKYLVDGYKQGIAGQNVYDYAEKMVNRELERIQRNSRNAARAAAATAMAAEAHRQQTVMDSIVSFGERMIRADQAVADRRMAQLAASTQAMMAFAGAHSVWYQPDKGETEADAVKAYYDNAIALVEKNRDAYDAYLTGTGASDETKQKAKADADTRIKALKEQQAAEIAAIRAQYQLQKDMATDWLNVQKEQLQQAFDARRKAYEEDDYQEELAALKKKERQSKSARERRELQAQIDKMERNHALDQEEEVLQITLDGYDQLIDAVRKGLIGLGDLTGNGAFGALSFGTAGLAGIDTLTGKTLQAVMASLSATSLQQATGSVTAQQLAAAL